MSADSRIGASNGPELIRRNIPAAYSILFPGAVPFDSLPNSRLQGLLAYTKLGSIFALRDGFIDAVEIGVPFMKRLDLPNKGTAAVLNLMLSGANLRTAGARVSVQSLVSLVEVGERVGGAGTIVIDWKSIDPAMPPVPDESGLGLGVLNQCRTNSTEAALIGVTRGNIPSALILASIT